MRSKGLGLGVLTEGLFKGLRYICDGRRIAAAFNANAAVAREGAKPREVDQVNARQSRIEYSANGSPI